MSLVIIGNRKYVFLIASVCVFFVCCTALVNNVHAFDGDYSVIFVDKPSSSKTPVAVPEFKSFKGHVPEQQDAQKGLAILKKALNFTGYLKTMNPLAFLSNPAQSGISLGEINFRDWKDIGAELLITGGITEVKGKITLELRLFDTFQSSLVVGRIYSGPRAQLRKMIHKFCSEISFALTGKWGVFNSKITFISKINGVKEVYTCDFDGENIKQETTHGSICLSPSWSPDGQWIAYVSYVNNSTDIFVKNLKGKAGAIVNYQGTNSSPGWKHGKDNPLLAASMTFSGDPEIYLLTTQGKIIKRVTQSWGIDVSPDFSPDGQQMVFTSRRHGTPQIYIKDIESGVVRRLTFNGRHNTSPSWSPDGQKVAYVGIEENQINIYVIEIDSGVVEQLTMDSGDNEDPAWSPDGTMLVFSSTREYGVPRIYVMNASGTDQRRLLKTQGQQTEPDWSAAQNTDD